MWKRLLVVSAVSANVVYGVGRSINRRIFAGRIGNLAGAPQKPMWRKVRPKNAELR